MGIRKIYDSQRSRLPASGRVLLIAKFFKERPSIEQWHEGRWRLFEIS